MLGKTKKLQVSRLYDLIQETNKSIIIFQGGTGSTKTYSILQYIILNCINNWRNKTIDIVRRTMPSLTISSMKDFFDILKQLEIYNEDNHNRSRNTYELATNTIRFYSSDDEQKVRGPRRDVVFFNEILEFKKMDVMQILMRTKELIFMDYNPSEEFHWVYDEMLSRKDVLFEKSTYKDNPFLTEKTRKEIERLKHTDPNLWRIYGLGERGVTQATIFSNWDYLDEFNKTEGKVLFGLDFGYNDPTALVKVKYHEKANKIYSKELLYKSNLTSDLIILELEKLVKKKELTKEDYIYADNARPEIIEDIKRAGFNIFPALKEKDSILRGINFIKKNFLYIDKTSTNLIKELRTYKWKVDKDDRVLDAPVDINNHLIDALRYALSKESKPSGQFELVEDTAGLFN